MTKRQIEIDLANSKLHTLKDFKIIEFELDFGQNKKENKEKEDKNETKTNWIDDCINASWRRT
jgi:hypothetical protein